MQYTAKINYLVLSDIHLGHDKNKTETIVEHLVEYFKEYHKVFSKLNIIFIAGDIFDKLLMPNSKQYLLAIEWLTIICKYCSHNGIKLRILEGTKSHDWQQASVMNTVLSRLNIDLDFKYIDTLAIEKMSDIDLSILYVPDEYNHKAVDTYKEVKELLRDNGLGKVDIAIMHGQFHYQLPMIVLESSHNEEDYIDIVKYYISIGHIHRHSVNGKILAQGSFDRLAQGEEEGKGGMLISIDKNLDRAEFRFIENKLATIFKTFDYSMYDDVGINKIIERDLKNIKAGSYIRLIVSIDSMLTKSKKDINIQYPNITVGVETINQKKSKEKSIDLKSSVVIDSFHITKDNIISLLNIAIEKHKLTKEELSILDEELLVVI